MYSQSNNAMEVNSSKRYMPVDGEEIAATTFSVFTSQSKNNSSGNITFSMDNSETSTIYSYDFIYTYVTLGVLIFGILGNIINLMVLTNKSMSKSMERMELSAHIGLVSLAVSDLLYCIAVLPRGFIPDTFAHERVNFSLIYDTYGFAVINIFAMSSTWLTVTMAVSRYLAICHPFRARLLIGKRFAKISTASVFLLSIVFNIPRFLERKVVKMANAYFVGYGPINRFNTDNADANRIYTWCYFALCIFLPFAVLTFCNYYLIKEVRSAPQRIERQCSARQPKNNHNRERPRLITLTLTLIVVLYIFLVSPAEVCRFIQHYLQIENVSYNMLLAIVNTIETINFSVNFILYCAINSHFRKVMRDVACAGRRQKMAPHTSLLHRTELE